MKDNNIFINWETLVELMSLDGNCIKVYLALWSFCDNEAKICNPSTTQLMKQTKLSKNTIKNCIKELEKHETIFTYPRKNKATLYVIMAHPDKDDYGYMARTILNREKPKKNKKTTTNFDYYPF